VAANVRRGFLLNKLGNFTSIDVPGASRTSAWAINAAGDIVGDYEVTPGGANRAFVLRDGIFATFDCAASLQAVNTFGFDISASGRVVGEYKRQGISLGTTGRAFHYENGTCVDITPPAAGPGPSAALGWTINDAGDAGGYFVALDGSIHGWIRDRHGVYATIDYPGSTFTNLRGLGASGDAVGLYRLGPGGTGPNRGLFRSADGAFSPLDVPGATRTRAIRINGRGDIVGDYAGGDCALASCGWVLRRPGPVGGTD
jgi:hypothetical protein